MFFLVRAHRWADAVTFRKSGSPAAIATEVNSLQWLAQATPAGGAPVAELISFGDGWLETRRLTHASPDRQ